MIELTFCLLIPKNCVIEFLDKNLRFNKNSNKFALKVIGMKSKHSYQNFKSFF